VGGAPPPDLFFRFNGGFWSKPPPPHFLDAVRAPGFHCFGPGRGAGAGAGGGGRGAMGPNGREGAVMGFFERFHKFSTSWGGSGAFLVGDRASVKRLGIGGPLNVWEGGGGAKTQLPLFRSKNRGRGAFLVPAFWVFRLVNARGVK